MRTYQLTSQVFPARHGREPRREVIETNGDQQKVFCLVPDSAAVDVVEALTGVYAAGRQDCDAERAAWWDSPLGRLVQDVVRRPDAEKALQLIAMTPVGGPLCGCGGKHWECPGDR